MPMERVGQSKQPVRQEGGIMQLSKVEKDVIRSMCDNNLSITAVARELNYQRGSIMYRVEKIKERTGRIHSGIMTW